MRARVVAPAGLVFVVRSERAQREAWRDCISRKAAAGSEFPGKPDRRLVPIHARAPIRSLMHYWLGP